MRSAAFPTKLRPSRNKSSASFPISVLAIRRTSHGYCEFASTGIRLVNSGHLVERVDLINKRMVTAGTFRALFVEPQDGQVRRSIKELTRAELPPGDVTVQIEYSALNYKDALAATGHPGVAKVMPLVPGIDATGTVIESSSARWKAGQKVLLADAKFGTESWGGMSRFCRVSNDWLIPLPEALSPYEAMVLGTAGFTAAQCVEALVSHGAKPNGGEIIVSGATGGVGVLAVMLLAKLGFQVVASTGKLDRTEWLKGLGAARVIDRQAISDRSPRPLLAGIWQGAVDTVGGNTLATILRATKPRGCVTACGLVGGHELNLTVYPFILRGVILCGIDSGNLVPAERIRIWNRLSTEWRLDNLKAIAQTVGLRDLSQRIDSILAGQIIGRTVIDLSLE